MDFAAIFLTGLTTGGLSCLAVQAGLLTTAMMRQVTISRASDPLGSNQTVVTGIQLSQTARPVMYFLLAKLAAYTVLGFLLGALGSIFQITSTVQAFMQLGVGLFMLVTALNMCNAHPIFRYFVIQPPKVLTRILRNQAKSSEAFAPFILGLLTVFIPCGTTQAMEVLAISSASPILGALILFIFVLGTSPTFFVLGFLASRLRGVYQSVLTIVAVLLLMFLGFTSLNNGLTLLGSPLAPSRILASFVRPAVIPTAQIVNGVQEITIEVMETSYFPDYVRVQPNYPIRLRLVTNRNNGCTRIFVMPNLGIEQPLPDTGETIVNLPPQPSGNLYFTCSMGMYRGIILVA